MSSRRGVRGGMKVVGTKLQFPTSALRQRLIGQENDGDDGLEGMESEPGPEPFEDEDEEDAPDADTPTNGIGGSLDEKIPVGVLKTLKNYHIAAAIFMSIAWITTLVVLLIYRFCSTPISLIGDTSSVFRRWGGTDPQFLGTFLYDPLPFDRGMNIVIPAVVFGFVPALIHLILAISPSVKKEGSKYEPLFLWYAKYALNNRVNHLRWIQYAFSYTFVAWILLQFSGVTDVITLGILIATKLALFGAMWIFEVQNQRRSRVNWETFGLGVFIFFIFWIAAMVYFVIQTISVPMGGSTPWYFLFFVYGSLVSCMLGGLIVIIHFMSEYSQKNNAAYEHWFIVHEIISIVFLSVILVVATIMAPPLPIIP